ncbi:hypothetical protein CDL15_Pgr023025 [Punica granatum]|jgi:hypothetical protein|uniref:Uncharacterized protein n=1 Tax=Punica granatum TaxID=22663 RepID=A0A218X3U5_PUNGR|nr:hypothetical protein CDL15_Pgr023025 [Punica granatum]
MRGLKPGLHFSLQPDIAVGEMEKLSDINPMNRQSGLAEGSGRSLDLGLHGPPSFNTDPRATVAGEPASPEIQEFNLVAYGTLSFPQKVIGLLEFQRREERIPAL